MADSGQFLAVTETAVPIVCQPGEGKRVGGLRNQSTFKGLKDQTGGAYAILEQRVPAGPGPAAACPPPRDGGLLRPGWAVRVPRRRPADPGSGGGAAGGPAGYSAYVPQCRAGRGEVAANRHPRALFQLLPRSG